MMVGLAGGTVLLIGIVAIPYPGPGWLIVFTGLAILGTEFSSAQRVLRWARDRYDAWTGWTRRQPPAVRLVVAALTGIIVLTTLWLMGTFGLLASWAGLQWDWVRSPLG